MYMDSDGDKLMLEKYENRTSTPELAYQIPLMLDNGLVINSSTPGSNKKFRITVDDSGAISATEVS